MNLLEIKDKLSEEVYGMTVERAKTLNVCIACLVRPKFYSPAGQAEYQISGMCEPCFDSISKGLEDVMREKEEPIREEKQDYDFETIRSSYAEENLKSDEYIARPLSNQLFIDIDSFDALCKFGSNLTRFDLHVCKVINEERKPSRNGTPYNHKQHIILTLERSVTSVERILFQALLGSDLTREMLSYIRVLNLDPHPTLFVEKAQKLLEGQNRLLITNKEELKKYVEQFKEFESISLEHIVKENIEELHGEVHDSDPTGYKGE